MKFFLMILLVMLFSAKSVFAELKLTGWGYVIIAVNSKDGEIYRVSSVLTEDPSLHETYTSFDKCQAALIKKYQNGWVWSSLSSYEVDIAKDYDGDIYLKLTEKILKNLVTTVHCLGIRAPVEF
jgi:hypothetical protein